MHNLVNIIGLSPSERSLEDYIQEVLEPERRRVRQALEAFVEKRTPSQKRKEVSKGKVTKAALKRLMKQYNLTVDELEKIMETDDGGENLLQKH